MKTLKEIFDIIEDNEISIDNYEENEKLCGYELNTYTRAGVNEIIFLDFRKEHQDPKNVNDFIKEFESWLNCETIDEKIDRNRQDPRYKEAFTIKESLKEFNQFYKKLKSILKQIKK